MHILLIEDNPGDVELIRQALRDRPVELEWIGDGESALRRLLPETVGSTDAGGSTATPEAYGRPAPDLILLDLKMPRMSGLEVLEQLDRDRSLRTLPVVVLTSSEAPGDVTRAYELHAAACFRKPPDGYGELMGRILAFFELAS
ncbi:MAG TPA: response regulator, partial [Sandaracinaceae bacterium LLY-WYZ-13_1]|nr:response regulator [Sandaracinaceae bacterium LLY-WYZ-13_1]